MTERTHTPDRVTVDADGRKTTTFKVKRCCNGCGQHLGDVTQAEMDRAVAGLPAEDVRAECARCAPLVELEAQGCKTWQLSLRNYARLLDHEIDRDGIFCKHFTECVDGKLTAVGIRIGERPNHVVARFGDHVIRHPDGRWTVRHAPADTGTEGQA